MYYTKRCGNQSGLNTQETRSSVSCVIFRIDPCVGPDVPHQECSLQRLSDDLSKGDLFAVGDALRQPYPAEKEHCQPFVEARIGFGREFIV